ncbi:hypothetical protein RB195_002359 [Necator americanus]|uniref:SCP domain-containing protein n=1 Tax=Necator americanus TaxID=51031 RepID=A0ABR1DIP1_NECAM
MPRKKLALASAETKSTYKSMCHPPHLPVTSTRNSILEGSCVVNRDSEWTSRAKLFEKEWENKNPRETYALLEQYGGKMKGCSPVFNTANGVAVGEATLLTLTDF